MLEYISLASCFLLLASNSLTLSKLPSRSVIFLFAVDVSPRPFAKDFTLVIYHIIVSIENTHRFVQQATNMRDDRNSWFDILVFHGSTHLMIFLVTPFLIRTMFTPFCILSRRMPFGAWMLMIVLSSVEVLLMASMNPPSSETQSSS